MSFNALRVRQVNDRPVRSRGRFVLYWMQAYRRLEYNHALDTALERAIALKKPLVVCETVMTHYSWANRRVHRFILEGMRDNQRRARELGLTYWPIIDSAEGAALDRVQNLADAAALVVTDDFPCSIVPGQIEALSRVTETPILAVDGNGVIPLEALGAPVSMAAHLRPRIHRLFPQSWPHRSRELPAIPASPIIDPPMPCVDLSRQLDEILDSLPIDQQVREVPGESGGPVAAQKRLAEFVEFQLPRYGEFRNHPGDPRENASSRLSAYLHHGHIAIEHVIEAVLRSDTDWSVESLAQRKPGRRDDYYSDDGNINAFLDEAITWRDLGSHWHRHRGAASASLKTALPQWAYLTLDRHASDSRDHLYSLEEWEQAETHDPLWNAAQDELRLTGRIHNYLRMLWGKKVLEWSEHPEQAYKVLEHLNNKYALDGHDPNSYTGILWCFGLFDRPWPPERKVYGTIRTMSSQNTARKYDLKPYFRYIETVRGAFGGRLT